MENNSFPEPASNEVDNSGTIFGTSSDTILHHLHNGDFTEPVSEMDQGNPGDQSKIVNQQDQNEIVNPAEIDINEEPVASSPTPMNNIDQPQETLEEETIVEDDITDDGIDSEREVQKRKSK